MEQKELIPHLFRNEYSKIVSVLCKTFGMAHMEISEDIASDTFLLAAETWGIKGSIPENPTAWLYYVAKNKAINYLRRDNLFHQKIAKAITPQEHEAALEIDISPQYIEDSQLQMMFAICHPVIPQEAQIGLSLRILCGFGIEEIADAFLTSKETINKRLFRAREKLRTDQVKIEIPGPAEINERLATVLTTLYLLFNEGYYSQSQNTQLRKELCLEAMRLTHSLHNYPLTDKPQVNALLALMCFHASRFESRTNAEGEMVLYKEQDENAWNQELITKGNFYLNRAATGDILSRYHLEAGIAYWHTIKRDDAVKWQNILQLYNHLLILEYTPIAALNRTYALSKVKGNAAAIAEAEKLDLKNNHLYHTLLGELYYHIDSTQSLRHLNTALSLAKSSADKLVISKKIARLSGNTGS
jgi:RNA polymerase sigma-70 factor (ECF subfamily)